MRPANQLLLFAFLAFLAAFPCGISIAAGDDYLGKDESISALMEMDTSSAPSANDSGYLDDIIRMFGVLALVLGLIALSAYLLRRFMPASSGLGRSNLIRIVATQMLGSRRSLMLVRVRGQTLLLGLTPQSITCLTEIHEVDGEWVQPAGSDGPKPLFEANLREMLKEKDK